MTSKLIMNQNTLDELYTGSELFHPKMNFEHWKEFKKFPIYQSYYPNLEVRYYDFERKEMWSYHFSTGCKAYKGNKPFEIIEKIISEHKKDKKIPIFFGLKETLRNPLMLPDGINHGYMFRYATVIEEI